MGRKIEPIKCRAFVPDGRGGYRPWDDLSPHEKQERGKQYAHRAAEAIAEAQGCDVAETKNSA